MVFLNGQIQTQLFSNYHHQKREVSPPKLKLNNKRIKFCQTNVIDSFVYKVKERSFISIFSGRKFFAIKPTNKIMRQVSNSQNTVCDLKTVLSFTSLFNKKIPNFEIMLKQCSGHISFISVLTRNNFVTVGSEKESACIINYNTEINVLKLNTNDTFITSVASQYD